MNNLIREATSNDLHAVWNLWKEIQKQEVFFAYQANYPRQQIEDSWINLNNHIYVYDFKGQVQGAYLMKPNQPGHGKHIVNAAYLVDNKVRGKGIGRILCKHSLEVATKLGYRGMQFNLVVSTNVGAISIWKSFGFKIIGTIPGGFHHVEKGYIDAYIFFKDLTLTT